MTARVWVSALTGVFILLMMLIVTTNMMPEYWGDSVARTDEFRWEHDLGITALAVVLSAGLILVTRRVIDDFLDGTALIAMMGGMLPAVLDLAWRTERSPLLAGSLTITVGLLAFTRGRTCQNPILSILVGATIGSLGMLISFSMTPIP